MRWWSCLQQTPLEPTTVIGVAVGVAAAWIGLHVVRRRTARPDG